VKNYLVISIANCKFTKEFSFDYDFELIYCYTVIIQSKLCTSCTVILLNLFNDFQFVHTLEIFSGKLFPLLGGL